MQYPTGEETEPLLLLYFFLWLVPPQSRHSSDILTPSSPIVSSFSTTEGHCSLFVPLHFHFKIQTLYSISDVPVQFLHRKIEKTIKLKTTIQSICMPNLVTNNAKFNYKKESDLFIITKLSCIWVWKNECIELYI